MGYCFSNVLHILIQRQLGINQMVLVNAKELQFTETAFGETSRDSVYWFYRYIIAHKAYITLGKGYVSHNPKV